jgi:hypothetical protein
MVSEKMVAGRSSKLSHRLLLVVAFTLALPIVWAQYPSSPQITKDGTAVLLQDYASMPPSSLMKDTYPAEIDHEGELSRVNTLHQEPANAPRSSSRFFVNDANGILYILDKNTKKFTPYIDFGLTFPQFTTDPGYEGGFVFVAFDPGYAKNGKFYTVHTERLNKGAAAVPTNAHLPGLRLDGYTVTEPVKPPSGSIIGESVLIEWTDTSIGNSTFEGTAREVLRIQFNQYIHQLDDLIFDPLAKPGSADYGNLYVAVGDGGSGETPGPTHTTPQRLDALQGKILRITPDTNLRPGDMLGANGRYRIPSTGADPNPFVSVNKARTEIFAYGFRNPQRLSWDAATNTLIANDIGLHDWEEVNVVTKGGNYGWAEREGNEQVFVPEGGKTGSQMSPTIAFPEKDRLTVEGLAEPVTPLYPVAVYSHQEGDSIGSGFVYRGKLMPQLRGKYIFHDRTTGRIFYSNLSEMLAAKGVHNSLAAIHEIQIMYKSPYDSSAKGPEKRRLYDILADAFAHKGGVTKQNAVLPGAAPVVGGWRGETFRAGPADPYGVKYGGGRADIHLAMGGDGELYVLSKSDGMIRKFEAVVTPPPALKAPGGQ